MTGWVSPVHTGSWADTDFRELVPKDLCEKKPLGTVEAAEMESLHPGKLQFQAIMTTLETLGN